MTLTPHTIKPATGATRGRKRVGRGNATGHGTYSGKGQKGQKSRAGVSNLKRLGMRQILLKTPKERGFKSDKPKNQVVNLELLNEHYGSGDTVSPQSLYKKGMISDTNMPVKILGSGLLKVGKLKFSKVRVSESARTQIEKLEGVINADKKR